MRGRRGRAEEEEEGGRRRRARRRRPCSRRDGEGETDRWGKRGWSQKNLELEAEAVVYIWFSGFRREAGEEEDKGEKLTEARESVVGKNPFLERRMEDPTARNIWNDVDAVSWPGADAFKKIVEIRFDTFCSLEGKN